MSPHSPTGGHAHPTSPDAADARNANDAATAPRTANGATSASVVSDARNVSDAVHRARPTTARRGAPPSQSAVREQATTQPHRRPGRPTSLEQASALDTRESILRLARGLFMQRGFADVSVGEVAELVGVTKPTLYYHFDSKQGLYTAVLCDMMREVGGYIEEVVMLDTSVRERLRLLAVGYLAHARMRMEPMLRDTFELIGQERAAEVIRAYHTYLIAPIANLLSAGVTSGEIARLDPDILTRAFLGLLDTFNDRDHERRPAPTDAAQAPRSAQTIAPAHLPAEQPGPRMAFSATAPLPASATTRLADTLVSLFMDGVATRPDA